MKKQVVQGSCSWSGIIFHKLFYSFSFAHIFVHLIGEWSYNIYTDCICIGMHKNVGSDDIKMWYTT